MTAFVDKEIVHTLDQALLYTPKWVKSSRKK